MKSPQARWFPLAWTALVVLAGSLVACSSGRVDDLDAAVRHLLDTSLPGAVPVDCHHAPGSDASIACAVRLGEASLEHPTGFALADASDQAYYLQEVGKAWPIEQAQAYRIYRGELSTPGDSLCSPAPCGAYIALRPGSRTAYVGLHKF